MGKPHALNVSDWGFESLAAYCDYGEMISRLVVSQKVRV